MDYFWSPVPAPAEAAPAEAAPASPLELVVLFLETYTNALPPPLNQLPHYAIPTFLCIAPLLFSILASSLATLLTSSSRRTLLANAAAGARKRREKKDHAECFSYNPQTSHTHYANMTASAIREGIVRGSIDMKECVAVCARHCTQNGSFRNTNGVNAIAEELYAEGFATAKLRHKVTQNPAPGLLEGVPISIKDCIGVKDTYQTGGLAVRTLPEHLSKTDSVLTATLRDAGAIPIVRGNVSQCMMLPESFNNVWGKSTNPWDKTRTPGGSSGGEGALVAMGCVPLAIGSDVGGSIRIPAAFCGVVGFKPTPGRISKTGCMAPRLDDRHGMGLVIPSAPGPLARSVDDSALAMKAIWSDYMFQRDSSIPPMKFNDGEYEQTKKLRIGYFVTDDWFEPCTAARRAVMETVENLKKAGHEVVPFKLPTSGWDAYVSYVALSASEGNMKSFHLGLEGETISHGYKKLLQAANLPNFLRPLVAGLLDERRSTLIKNTRSGGLTAFELQSHMADAMTMRHAWADAFQEAQLDAIVHTALPLPALHCGTSGDLTSAFSYTLLANLLLWPSGVVPVTTIQEGEDNYLADKELPKNQRDHWARQARKCMAGSKGLPMAVSVLTPTYADETCLRVMKEVEKLAGFKAVPQAYKEQ